MRIVSANITGSVIVNGVDVTDALTSTSQNSGSISQKLDSLQSSTSSLNSFTSSINTTIKNYINSETVISGSAQVLITGTTGYSTFSSSISTSIGSLSSSVATTTSNLSSSIGSLSGSVATTTSNLSSSVGSLSGSLATTTSNLSSSVGSLSSSVATTTLNLSSSVSSSIGSLSGSVATTTSELSTTIGNLSSSVATTTSNLSSSIGSLSSSVATTTSGLSSSIGSLSSSVATTTSGLAGRITTIEGNYATTGSNRFIGTQTITGSLFISQNLIVQGSSSLENITASAVNIGSNIVNLNTANPAIRFAGLSIFDSGSIGGSGSFLYDSVQDEFIFVHRGDNANITSSVVLMGPQTYNNVGSESYPTNNRLLKGTGNEHVGDSCIIDDGTTVCVNTTLKASGQVCGVMGTFSCVGIGTTTPFKKLTINTSGTASEGVVVSGDSSPAYIICETSGVGSTFTNDSAAGYIGTITNHPFNVRSNSQNRLTFSNAGVASFACQVCAPSLISSGTICSTGNTCFGGNSVITGCLGVGTTPTQRLTVAGNVLLNGTSTSLNFNTPTSGNGDISFDGNALTVVSNSTSACLLLSTNSTPRLQITSTGIACFACQVCTISLTTADLRYTGAGFITYDTSLSGTSNLIFRQDATERMRITCDGYVAVTGNQSLKCVPYLQGMSFGWNRSNGQGESMINWTNQGGGTSCDLTFNFRNNTTLFERMRITAAGNLGIGTDAPNYTLQVNGTSCFAGNVAIGGSYCAFALNVHGVTYGIGGSFWTQNGYGYVNAGATTTGLYPMSDNTIQLRVNNSTALTINSGGVSCFVSTVCAPGIIVGTNQENTILSSSRIHLNTCVQRFYTINHWSLANGSFSCTVVDGAATYGCAKVMPLNGSSTFFFGPYSYLTPGSYVAKFRMKVDNNSSTSRLFGLDTSRGGGQQVSPSAFCTSGCYQYINLPFTISSPSDVFEARALDYAPGITCAYLDHVLIEAAENPGQYFSKDRFNLYAGAFNTPRLTINTDGSMIFNCNGSYCSNYGYNFLCANNGTILSGAHIMGNMGAGTFCTTPLWCLNGGNGGSLRMELNWATNAYVNWTNHNNCTPFLLNWSADNFTTKHCFDYVGNARHCGIVIAKGYQGEGFSTLSAGSGTGTASFDTITRSGVGLYEVSIIANPNAGGSDYYDFWYGHVIIGRGYNGSAVTDYISWCQESPPPRTLYPSGGGNMTVTACMFYSGAEYSSISRDGSYTIRFKIGGYNSSYTGANTTIFLKLII